MDNDGIAFGGCAGRRDAEVGQFHHIIVQRPCGTVKDELVRRALAVADSLDKGFLGHSRSGHASGHGDRHAALPVNGDRVAGLQVCPDGVCPDLCLNLRRVRRGERAAHLMQDADKDFLDLFCRLVSEYFSHCDTPFCFIRRSRKGPRRYPGRSPDASTPGAHPCSCPPPSARPPG